MAAQEQIDNFKAAILKTVEDVLSKDGLFLKRVFICRHIDQIVGCCPIGWYVLSLHPSYDSDDGVLKVIQENFDLSRSEAWQFVDGFDGNDNTSLLAKFGEEVRLLIEKRTDKKVEE